MGTKTIRSQVVEYSPGFEQDSHRHGDSYLSIILAGTFAEDGPHFRLRPSVGSVGFKHADVKHANQSGLDGTLVVSLVIGDNDWQWLGRPDRAYFWANSPETLRLAIALSEAIAREQVALLPVYLADILTVPEQGNISNTESSSWLREMGDFAHAGDIAGASAVAARAGIEGTRASKLFRRTYGWSLTEFARYSRCRNAMGALVDPSTRLADVAVASGFYDEAQLIKSFRLQTGRTPGNWRRIVQQLASLAQTA